MYQQLLGGILAVFRTGSIHASIDLLDAIRSGAGLAHLATHVDGARRGDPAVEEGFSRTEVVIDEDSRLPPPAHLIGHQFLFQPAPQTPETWHQSCQPL